MALDTSIKSVLLIGSGYIVIGQACEFDYSGTQALRALREDGIETILINSNPATIMTDPSMADYVYLLPLTTKSIEEILQKHPNIDAVLPTMGGQTALNLCMEADDKGIWKEFGVRILGVDISTIQITEDRDQFTELMRKIGVPIAPAKIANSYLSGKEIAQEFGFPLIIRPSFTLGGSGAAFVHTEGDFNELLTRGLEASPIHEVQIDKALLGWKEYELEMLRDKDNNITVVCTIENMDPMGVHTGDSITVAPAMTLSQDCFERMRELAVRIMLNIGEFTGGCNVQFAVSPDEKEEIIAIEINPRVSRSSALASKATGYPIAKVATKLAVGHTLKDITKKGNRGNGTLFEPELDYVIVKIPKWDFDKFEGANRELGVQMKAVGEVMGIGSSFQEALHKATQSLEVSRNGLGADGKGDTDYDEILYKLKHPSWDRVFVIYDAIELGVPLERIHDLTKIDLWYLNQFKELYQQEKELKKHTIATLDFDLLLQAKQKGFGDRQIAYIIGCLESEVHNKRMELGVHRAFVQVDTCVDAFDFSSPYYYSSFGDAAVTTKEQLAALNESKPTDNKKIIVLGSGPIVLGRESSLIIVVCMEY